MQTSQTDETHHDSESIGGWVRIGDKPLQEAITAAAVAYRAQHRDRPLTAPQKNIHDVCNSINGLENKQFTSLNCLGNANNLCAGIGSQPSERTKLDRDSIRHNQPNPFNIGARCGFYATEHDVLLFNSWSLAERDSFFAGANYGRCQRLRIADIRETAE